MPGVLWDGLTIWNSPCQRMPLLFIKDGVWIHPALNCGPEEGLGHLRIPVDLFEEPGACIHRRVVPVETDKTGPIAILERPVTEEDISILLGICLKNLW